MRIISYYYLTVTKILFLIFSTIYNIENAKKVTIFLMFYKKFSFSLNLLAFPYKIRYNNYDNMGKVGECSMKNQRFKPLFDKTYKSIWISLSVLMACFTLLAVFEPTALFVMIPTDLFVLYFLLSPLFGYVELREDVVFIRFGLILKREIPYEKIRGLTKERKFYSDSMLALKNAMEHVNIKYNTFDIMSVSVVESAAFIQALEQKLAD